MTKKVMMQMWKNRAGRTMLQEAGYVGFGYDWVKVGEPLEIVYPEESK